MFMVIMIILVILVGIIFFIRYYDAYSKIKKTGDESAEQPLNTFLTGHYTDSAECLLHRLGANGAELIFQNDFPMQDIKDYSEYIEKAIEFKLKNFTKFQGRQIEQESPVSSVQANENDVSVIINHKVSIRTNGKKEEVEDFIINLPIRYKYLTIYREKIKAPSSLKLEDKDIEISAFDDIDVDVKVYEVKSPS